MPGFFESFTDTSGLNWISKDEKAILIDESVEFPILSVTRAESKFGPRYVVVTEIEGETRALGFPVGTVESRDRMFDSLEKYLQGEDAEPPTVKLVRVGNSILVKDASAVQS